MRRKRAKDNKAKRKNEKKKKKENGRLNGDELNPSML